MDLSLAKFARDPAPVAEPEVEAGDGASERRERSGQLPRKRDPQGETSGSERGNSSMEDSAGTEVEAGDGIEPTHRAFAEPGLTTWLPRRFSGDAANAAKRAFTDTRR